MTLNHQPSTQNPKTQNLNPCPPLQAHHSAVPGDRRTSPRITTPSPGHTVRSIGSVSPVWHRRNGCGARSCCTLMSCCTRGFTRHATRDGDSQRNGSGEMDPGERRTLGMRALWMLLAVRWMQRRREGSHVSPSSHTGVPRLSGTAPPTQDQRRATGIPVCLLCRGTSLTRNCLLLQ